MKTQNEWRAFGFACFLMGACFGTSLIYSFSVWPPIRDCERNLPRLENCVLTAVPEQ